MLTLRSPAKINLFLKVVNRRPDGYHNLASLFQAIDLSDQIQFSINKHYCADHLTCTDPTIPTDHSNLILNAADLFRRKTGFAFGLEAHLEKNIPHQAGFGGGSSNAATTLWALNQLHGSPFCPSELMQWSAEIGSDIPFFFSHGTAYCTGRGEVVQCLSPLKQTNLWLIKPKNGLPTAAVFNQLNIKNLSNHDPKQILDSHIKKTPLYFNDLEQPAFDLLPELATLKQKLLSFGFDTVLMSGSGSGFFCLGDVCPSTHEDALLYKTTFLNRSDEEWY